MMAARPSPTLGPGTVELRRCPRSYGSPGNDRFQTGGLTARSSVPETTTGPKWGFEPVRVQERAGAWCEITSTAPSSGLFGPSLGGQPG